MDSHKSFFSKHEWIFLLIALALFVTFVPMLVSAASTALNVLGLALGVGFGVWLYQYFKRFANNNF